MLLILACLGFTADESAFTAMRSAAAPPTEVAAAVRELLAGDCDTVSDAAGAVVAEVWFRAELPAKATADQVANGLTYRELVEGSVVAAVRFPKPFVDFRKQTIPAGVYTLRLCFQPDTGDHAGTAPHTEFALLCPAADDTSADAVEPKAVVTMSKAATGGDHPGVMLLFPHAAKADGVGVAAKSDGVWVLTTRRPAATDDRKTTIGVALTVAGHSKTR